MPRPFHARTLLFAACLAAAPSHADILTLRNGDRITGSVDGLKDGRLDFTTPYAGTIAVPETEIAGLVTDGPVTLRYEAGGYVTGRLAAARDGSLLVLGIDDDRPLPIDLAAIAEIHPGTEIPRGFKWTGRINLGATRRDGNTESHSIHGDAAIKGRAENDRIRFEGAYNREFTDGERNADDFTVFAQHDHFVSDAIYLYTNAKLKRDKPQDLNLRTTVGTGGGWQILQDGVTNLSVEAGPSYAVEDYDAGEDGDYIAARWAVNFDRYVWTKFAQLFHQHQGTVDVGDTGNVNIDSSTGVRFPFSDGFNLTAQADIEWDSDPAPDTEAVDTTYLLTVGYSW